MKSDLTMFNKKTIEKLKAESEGWGRKESLDNIGVCTQSTIGTISGNEYIGAMKEYKFYDKDKNMYRITTRNKSIKVFTGTGRDLDEVIQSDADYRKIMRIMKHLNNLNMVMLENNMKKKAVPATRVDLMVYTRLNQRLNNEFFLRMKKLGILKEDDNKKIYVNPLYCLASTGISPEVYCLFKNDLDKVLPEIAINEIHTILYFELHPEELKKEMFCNDMTEEEVIEKYSISDDYKEQLKTQRKNDLKKEANHLIDEINSIKEKNKKTDYKNDEKVYKMSLEIKKMHELEKQLKNIKYNIEHFDDKRGDLENDAFLINSGDTNFDKIVRALCTGTAK